MGGGFAIPVYGLRITERRIAAMKIGFREFKLRLRIARRSRRKQRVRRSDLWCIRRNLHRRLRLRNSHQGEHQKGDPLVAQAHEVQGFPSALGSPNKNVEISLPTVASSHGF